jgi:hypothetical protein
MKNAKHAMQNRLTLHLVPAALLIVAFAAMLWWTWLGWPDPVVDFGRELYVPWRLSAGEALYRDIAYFNGPFSPYFNALMMKLFGVSLATIVTANLVILALLVAMVYRIVLLVGDRLAATLAGVLVICVFAFLQLGGVGNYNFVTPYSHEITHGVALSFAALLCVARFVRTGRTIWAAAAGLVLGLVFLTKPEVFVAAAGAASIGILVALRSRRVSRGYALAVLGQYAASVLVAPILAGVLLLIRIGPADAVRGVFGGWLYLFDPRLNQMKFYQRVFGTLSLANTAHSVVIDAIWYAALAAVVTAIALTIRARWHANRWVFAVALVVSSAGMYGIYQLVPTGEWQIAFRGLSLVMFGIVIALLVWIARLRRHAGAIEERAVLRLVLAIFALLLLGKVFLNVLLYHYGFALTMPAAIVVVAASASWGPQIIDRTGGSGHVARAAAVSLVGLVIFVHLRVYGAIYSRRDVTVGSGRDQFRARDARGLAVDRMIEVLRKLPPGATVATVPEGAMINYLARRVNPTGYINLMPPEVVMFGQRRILEAFERRPPNYVVRVLASDSSDAGFKSFELDYGREVYAWIMQHYRSVPTPPEAQIGEFPLLLLERK